jgi:DinB superfamily
MPRLHPSIALLLDLVDEAFDRAAWHGPTLRGSLRGVTPAQAAWRPAATRHNIRELTVHAAYWKYAVRRRLTGATRGSFALPGSNWFEIPRGRPWPDDVRLLADEHRQLRAAIAAYPASKLSKAIDAKKQTAAFSIRGIAAHDLYHAGQIQLLKKLQRGSW